jgi:hypothetical protein
MEPWRTPTETVDELDDENEHRTHIISPVDNLHIWRGGMATLDILDVARFGGLELFVLCGYRFVPVRSAETFVICENCLEVAHKIMNNVRKKENRNDRKAERFR